MSPSDPVALVTLADMELSSGKSSLSIERIRSRALLSLRGQALNARAVRILGLVQPANTQATTAKALVQLSEKLSRREVGAQFWLIDHEVSGGNIPEILKHYDIALRTSPTSREVLLPILIQALDDDAIQHHLVPYIRSDSLWLYDMFTEAIGKDLNLEGVAKLLMRSKGGPAASKYRDVEMMLIERLVINGKLQAASDLAMVVNPAARSISKSVAITTESVDRRNGPFHWHGFESSAASASFGRAEDDKALNLRATVSSGERLATAHKILALAPGSYRLKYHIKPAEVSNHGSAMWQLSCVSGVNRTPLMSAMIVPDRGDDGGFTISANCPFQLLELVMAGGDNSDGLSLTVDHLSLQAGASKGAAQP